MLARRSLFAALVLLMAAQTGYALSIEEIIDLSKASVGDEVIVAQIEATGAIFALSAADLIRLKENGVSERVLMRMIQTRQARREEAAARLEGSLSERANERQRREDEQTVEPQQRQTPQSSAPYSTSPDSGTASNPQIVYVQPQAPTTVVVQRPTYVVTEPVQYVTPTYYAPPPVYYTAPPVYRCAPTYYYTPVYYSRPYRCAPTYYSPHSHSSFSVYYGERHHRSSFGVGFSFGFH